MPEVMGFVKVKRANCSGPTIHPKLSQNFPLAIRLYKRQVKAWEQWEDTSKLMQAGADRNMLRHATHDGLRVIAWLAKYVEQGQDPLKEIVKMVVDQGYDVEPSDVTWAEEEEEEG